MANLPTHIGYIVDGNRRWAKAHGKTAREGHEAGRVVPVSYTHLDVYKRQMSDKIHTIHSDEHPPHEAGMVTGEIVDGFAQEQGLGAVVIDMTARLSERRYEEWRREQRVSDERDREVLAEHIEKALKKLGELIAELRGIVEVGDDALLSLIHI